MKTRPSTTVGCPYADVVAGSPKAHFRLSRETEAGWSPAALVGWKRALKISWLQPFHPGAVRSLIGGLLEQRFCIDFTSPLPEAPSERPATHSAISRFCWSVRSLAWLRMSPVVRAS